MNLLSCFPFHHLVFIETGHQIDNPTRDIRKENMSMVKKKCCALILALCMVLSLVMLGGCGSGSADKGETEKTEAPAKKQSVTPDGPKDEKKDDTADEKKGDVSSSKFVGEWKIAGAQAKGVIMGGDFGSILGTDTTGNLNIKEDGTGDMSFGDEKVKLTWKEESADEITIIPEDDTDYTGDKVSVKYKDNALFMTAEQDGEEVAFIYTADGKFDGVKDIDMKKTEAITSEKDLLGEWELTGMKIYGVAVSGDAEHLAELGGGTEPEITFKEGGVASMSSEESKYKIDKDGAVIMMKGLTGDEISCPVKKLDDDIVIDMSEVFGGVEFTLEFSKDKADKN